MIFFFIIFSLFNARTHFFFYDAQGRLRQEIDARNGATTLEYDVADQLIAERSPAPGGLGSAQTVSNYFNNMGWVWKQRLADGSSLTNIFTARGELERSYGSQSYPVEYGYDAQGRLKTLQTWQDFAGNSGTAVTTWNYETNRGFLLNKRYDDNTGPSYSYTPAGRTATRAWARGVTTSYGYDNGGGLSSISYSDGVTPGVSRAADRRGRTKTLAQNSITTTMGYGGGGRKLSESYSGGVLGGLAVTNSYDGFLRRSSVIAAGYGGSLNSYGYDIAGRLATVGDGTNTATYSYLGNSRLYGQITFAQGANTRLTTTKAYDHLDRLTSILSTPTGANMAAASFNYVYNDLNQRTRESSGDSAWIYGYDSIGQLTSGKKYWPEGEAVEGQQFEYVYDDIGNRKSAQEGGDVSGANLRSATYTPNALNQYTARTVPDKVNILGHSTTASTVQVNGSNADYRHGPYFREELGVANTGTNALWQSVTVTAGSDTTTGNLLIPGQTQNFRYDADGNLTNDYVWTYVYNGENQLVEIKPLTNSPAASKKWLKFTYDFAGRRIQKTVATLSGSTWTLTVSNRFLYDRWNLIAELNATNNALIRGYIWGQDLSGTLQGAGGVGGLAVINDPVNGSHFATHDGKGNVAALVKASDGSYSALYEYDPYGRVLRANGAMVAKNPFRFSTKYEDSEVGLIYYGYRYYNASLGKWQNRDPIEELGGFNVYGMVYNDPANFVDPFGLEGDSDGLWDLWLRSMRDNGLEDALRFGIRMASNAVDAGIASYKAINHPIETIANGIRNLRDMADLAKRLITSKCERDKFGRELRDHFTSPEGIADITFAIEMYLAPGAARQIMGAEGAVLGPSCFVAGTLVAVEGGFKPIEEIVPGDKVWAFDEETGEVALKTVLDAFDKPTGALVTLEFDSETVVTTPDHPFWVEGSGWIVAGELEEGDFVRALSSAPQRVSHAEQTAQFEKVYNLEVEDFHSYFVSQTGILVHNEGLCKRGPYRGGPHGKTKKPSRDGFDSHHSPADDVTDLPRDKGPAFQMDPADHAKMPSTGSSHEAQAYRAKQSELIQQGKFREAQQMDIDAAQRLFGNKYNEAIQEMLDYSATLGLH